MVCELKFTSRSKKNCVKIPFFDLIFSLFCQIVKSEKQGYAAYEIHYNCLCHGKFICTHFIYFQLLIMCQTKVPKIQLFRVCSNIRMFFFYLNKKNINNFQRFFLTFYDALEDICVPCDRNFNSISRRDHQKNYYECRACL